MTMFCCVPECHSHSRRSDKISFRKLPRQRDRRLKWIKAIKRDDLLSDNEGHMTDKSAYSLICSRHFDSTTGSDKPCNFIPDVDKEQTVHPSIFCNSCKDPVIGFRYKCMECDCYNLCTLCERYGEHSQHCMMRIPQPLSNKSIKKIQTSSKINKNHEDSSDDDTPITKLLAKKSEINLEQSVKDMISKEVIRALESSKKRSKKNVNSLGAMPDVTFVPMEFERTIDVKVETEVLDTLNNSE